MADRRFSIRALIAGAAVILATISATSGTAATVDGEIFRVEYFYPHRFAPYGFTNGPQYGVISGADAVLSVEGLTDKPGVTNITIAVDPGNVRVTLNTALDSPTWNAAFFNGVIVTILNGSFNGFASGGNSTFGPPNVSIFGNSLAIDFGGLAFVDGSMADRRVSFVAPTIPLPAALPLLLAGLGAVGVVGLWRDRNARA